ncbi:MAG: hypothetical protein JXR07_17115 [Reichenbachiella sp.]
MESIKKGVLEMLSIVFAVLLALGLTHWREEVNQQNTSNKALTNILVELHANKLELEGEFEELKKRIDSLVVLKGEIENGKGDKRNLGFNMPVLSNSAWKAANAMGAVDRFELQLLMDLSTLYRFQEMFQENGMAYFRQFSSLEFNKDENLLAVVKSNITQAYTTYSLGEQLNKSYVDFYIEHSTGIAPFLPDSLKSRYVKSE